MAKGERKIQILQTLAHMLETPTAERVTTAALAAKVEVSEAALYRHFTGKAQMYEGLIEFVEDTLFVLIDHRGPSYLVAIDKANGKNRWKAEREQRGGWASPVVATRRITAPFGVPLSSLSRTVNANVSLPPAPRSPPNGTPVNEAAEARSSRTTLVATAPSAP